MQLRENADVPIARALMIPLPHFLILYMNLAAKFSDKSNMED